MPRRRFVPARHPVRHWLFAVFAMIATMAQLAVALAPLSERPGGMASHVESHSATTHYAHDEARCPSCQARSILGDVEGPALPVIAVRLAPSAAEWHFDRPVFGDPNPQTNPRAPPSVI